MGIGHGNSDKPEHDEPMITVSELARMVRLSRATIQYYEKIGILNPDRTDNRHRYPASDCVRLTNTMTLKNLGVELDDILPLLEDEPFSERHMKEYCDALASRKAYLDAQLTMLERYIALSRKSDAVAVEEIEPFYFKPSVPWSAEIGTSGAGDEPMYMPISGSGALFEGDDYLHPVSVAPGRAVPVRFASLITGFDEDLQVMGGCTCIVGVWHTSQITFTSQGLVRWDGLFAKFEEHAAKHHLVAAGRAFSPYGLAIYGVSRALVCLPVKKKGIMQRISGR